MLTKKRKLLNYTRARILHYLIHTISHLRLLFRWLIFATITGLVVGIFATLFAWCMLKATSLRQEHSWLMYFLPLGGIVIVWLYSLFHDGKDKGTNTVISSLHAEAEIPYRMAPMIFISTVLTHLFGGSAGREGAALQLGGSIGSLLGKFFKFDEADKRVVIMCGMSAAFSAVFGTPIAAAIFAMEVGSVGVMYYASLVPCVTASLVASNFAINMGLEQEHFPKIIIPELNLKIVILLLLLAILCAGLSVLFCMLLHGLERVLPKYLKSSYLRITVAGTVLILLTLILQSKDYLGAGTEVIHRAISGQVIWYAFLIKAIFTAITISSGFKGGEIVPSFFIGATFGCLFGQITNLPPSLCAALGMVSVFCGVTNCPITSLIISFELFGFQGVPYFLICISISYMLSGYYGLYHAQKIVYSKYKTKYINRHTRLN